jgi:hypothetical protein
VLDQLGNPGRIGVVGITPRDVVHVGRVEQPALHLVLEEVPARLPVAPGRLHPHPDHPVAGWPATRPPLKVRGGRGEPAGLGVAPTMAVGHPHAGGHRHLCTSKPAQRSTSVSISSPPPGTPASGRHPEEPLPGESQSRARGNSAGCPRPPRQTYQRARGTKQHQRRPDDQPISHPSRVAEHGHQRLIRDRRPSALLSSLSAGRATP